MQPFPPGVPPSFGGLLFWQVRGGWSVQVPFMALPCSDRTLQALLLTKILSSGGMAKRVSELWEGPSRSAGLSR